MKLKEGVNLDGVSWRMFFAAIAAEKVYQKFGAELVITAGVDGKHMEGSLHYKGLALDLRTFNLKGYETQVAEELRKELGDDYDVVLEGDHIHCEYDPS